MASGNRSGRDNRSLSIKPCATGSRRSGVGERRGPTALQRCSARVGEEKAERNRAPAWNLAVVMGTTLAEVQEMAARFFRGRLLFAGRASGESGDTKARGLFRLWVLYLYILTPQAAHPIRRVEATKWQERERLVPMKMREMRKDQHAFGALGSCVSVAGSGGL
jgi:hypothetical protein